MHNINNNIIINIIIGKIAVKCEEVNKALEVVRVKYNQEMRTEQLEFSQTLVQLEKDVVALENFKSLKEVHAAAEQVK